MMAAANGCPSGICSQAPANRRWIPAAMCWSASASDYARTKEATAFKRIMRPQGVALPVLGCAVWVKLDDNGDTFADAAHLHWPGGSRSGPCCRSRSSASWQTRQCRNDSQCSGHCAPDIAPTYQQVPCYCRIPRLYDRNPAQAGITTRHRTCARSHSGRRCRVGLVTMEKRHVFLIR